MGWAFGFRLEHEVNQCVWRIFFGLKDRFWVEVCWFDWFMGFGFGFDELGMERVDQRPKNEQDEDGHGAWVRV